MKNGIIIFIIGFVLGIGSTLMYVENKSTNGVTYIDEESQSDTLLSGENRVPIRNTAAANNRIVVPNQESGGLVTIQFVSFKQPGWVVIHELLSGGNLGSALGAQRFDEGEYSGGVSLLRVTESGSTYAAVLYLDNGDRRFDIGIDLPELGGSHEMIQTTFTIL